MDKSLNVTNPVISTLSALILTLESLSLFTAATIEAAVISPWLSVTEAIMLTVAMPSCASAIMPAVAELMRLFTSVVVV